MSNENNSGDEQSRFDAAVSGQLSFEQDVITAVHDAEMNGLTYREMVVVLDEIAEDLERDVRR